MAAQTALRACPMPSTVPPRSGSAGSGRPPVNPCPASGKISDTVWLGSFQQNPTIDPVLHLQRAIALHNARLESGLLQLVAGSASGHSPWRCAVVRVRRTERTEVDCRSAKRKACQCARACLSQKSFPNHIARHDRSDSIEPRIIGRCDDGELGALGVSPNADASRVNPGVR